MNIKRTIDKNYKLIWYIVIIVIFALFIIKALNAHYEEDERKKAEEWENSQSEMSNNTPENPEMIKYYYNTESNSIEKTMRSFVKYCNSREIENAYKMLTEECKNAMFPSIEEFEDIYVNKIFNIEREYELIQWAIDGNLYVYHAKLYGDILATGNADDYIQEYYTFVKQSDGIYKLNVNNYICGEDKNVQDTVKGITVKIGHVDTYEEYEEMTITVTNNTSKTICLTGNKYMKNIYLKNSKKTTYSSLNSKFDNENIVLDSRSIRTFTVRFNKSYNARNKAKYLVLSDVILDYENYSQSDDKSNYSNRTSIEVEY